MDSDDPDLEACKSNLCRIFGERELGKAAALVSNLCPYASDSQAISVSSKDNARRESPVTFLSVTIVIMSLLLHIITSVLRPYYYFFFLY